MKMDRQQKQFLEGMWARVEEKEQNEKLAKVWEKKTPRRGVAAFFWDLYRELGPGQLLAGMGDVFCLAFVISLLVLYLLMKCMADLVASADLVVFCASPVLYVCIFLLFWCKDVQNGCYGLHMSYKYTFFHVLAVRMLAASFLGMGGNGLYILVLFLQYKVDVIRLLAVSFSSLTCFSVLLLAGMERGRRVGWAVAVCGIWLVLHVTALLYFPQVYGAFLGWIPVYVFLATGLCSLWLYLRQLQYLTTLLFRKEYSDATA